MSDPRIENFLENTKNDILQEKMWIEIINRMESLYAQLANRQEEIEQKNRELLKTKEFVENVIENTLRDYLGSHVFDGGCFFLNMLVELSGQSTIMSQQILRGFIKFSQLLQKWLEEAKQKEMLRDGLNFEEITNFIIISMTGTAALYFSTKEPKIWNQALTQLLFFTKQLRK